MTEREMEDLLWSYPERLLNEPLKQFRRQPHTGIGRPDLIFETRLNQLLLIEIKKGAPERGVIDQIYDYFGALKKEFPQRSVELMVLATERLHEERRIALESLHVECRVVPVKQFRALARSVGYPINSEATLYGAGDVGEFGLVEVDYGEGTDFCDPGKWIGINEIVDENKLQVRYFYDDAEPETVTLFRGLDGIWLDYRHDTPVTINFQPSPERIEDFKRRFGA